MDDNIQESEQEIFYPVKKITDMKNDSGVNSWKDIFKRGTAIYMNAESGWSAPEAPVGVAKRQERSHNLGFEPEIMTLTKKIPASAQITDTVPVSTEEREQMRKNAVFSIASEKRLRREMKQ